MAYTFITLLLLPVLLAAGSVPPGHEYQAPGADDGMPVQSYHSTYSGADGTDQ
jgi:hypothetical protein